MSYADVDDYEDEDDDSHRPTKKRKAASSTKYKDTAASEELPAFVSKLYEICHSANEDYLVWSDDGGTFTIVNEKLFCDDYLSKYYSSSHFGSFVRQLNLYGFRKTRKDKSNLEFCHPFFKKHRFDLLSNVIRKTNTTGRTMNNEEVLGGTYTPTYGTRVHSHTTAKESSNPRREKAFTTTTAATTTTSTVAAPRHVYGTGKSVLVKPSVPPMNPVEEIEEMKEDIVLMKDAIELLKASVHELVYSLSQQRRGSMTLEGIGGRERVRAPSINSIDFADILPESSSMMGGGDLKRRRLSSQVSQMRNGRAGSWDFMLSPVQAPEDAPMNNGLMTSVFSLAKYSPPPVPLFSDAAFQERVTSTLLTDMGYSYATCDVATLRERPFRMKITDVGRQLAAIMNSTTSHPQHANWDFAAQFFSDWISVMNGVDVIGRFSNDNMLTQPVSKGKTSYSIVYSTDGKQQIQVQGFPPLDIVRKGEDGPITLLIPQMLITQLSPAESQAVM